MAFQFGTGIPQYLMFQETARGRHEGIARIVKAIEDAGYSYITVGDHIIHPGVSHHQHEDPAKVIYGDVFSVLTYYGALSKKLKLVTGVLILPYRQPFASAHAAATVDQLTGGRFILGIGPGYAKVEFRAFGIPLNERGPMTDEYLDIMALLLSQQNVSFHGRYYSFENVSLLFPPVQKPRPPIWIGGSGKRALERAILRGDVWNPIASGVPLAGKRPIRVAVTPRELEQDLKYANQRRKDLGKSALGCTLSAAMAILFTEQPVPQTGPLDIRDRYMSGHGAPEQLAEQINAYKQAGAQGVSIGLTSMTVDQCLREIETVATKVMPLVK